MQGSVGEDRGGERWKDEREWGGRPRPPTMRSEPSSAKAESLRGVCGTAEAVPFPEQLWKLDPTTSHKSLLRPTIHPLIHRLVPKLGILRLQDPVAFVGEVEHL